MNATEKKEHQHFALIAKSDKAMFHIIGDRRPELVQLVQLHQPWLIHKLKDHMIGVYWDDGDEHALACLMPVDKDDHPIISDAEFVTCKLKFPPRKPRLM